MCNTLPWPFKTSDVVCSHLGFRQPKIRSRDYTVLQGTHQSNRRPESPVFNLRPLIPFPPLLESLVIPRAESSQAHCARIRWQVFTDIPWTSSPIGIHNFVLPRPMAAWELHNPHASRPSEPRLTRLPQIVARRPQGLQNVGEANFSWIYSFDPRSSPPRRGPPPPPFPNRLLLKRFCTHPGTP